jgi:hypothetical protein
VLPCRSILLRVSGIERSGRCHLLRENPLELEPQLRADAADRGELPRGLPLHRFHRAS